MAELVKPSEMTKKFWAPHNFKNLREEIANCKASAISPLAEKWGTFTPSESVNLRLYLTTELEPFGELAMENIYHTSGKSVTRVRRHKARSEARRVLEKLKPLDKEE